MNGVPFIENGSDVVVVEALVEELVNEVTV